MAFARLIRPSSFLSPLDSINLPFQIARFYPYVKTVKKVAQDSACEAGGREIVGRARV
jgi:hypothetical protein